MRDIIMTIIMISNLFKCRFDTIISQVFYLRPKADEGLLAFLYGKNSLKNQY